MSGKYVVPIREFERGFGNKVDGHAGPFDTRGAAVDFQDAYNRKHCAERIVPDWYMRADDPVPHEGQICDYGVTV